MRTQTGSESFPNCLQMLRILGMEPITGRLFSRFRSVRNLSLDNIQRKVYFAEIFIGFIYWILQILMVL